MRTASRQWSSSSRRLAALFLAVVVPSAVTLVWLGVRLLEQDQRLWADRDLERREAAADILVRALGQTLASAETALSGGSTPEGALLATLSPAAVRVRSSQHRILWTPAPPLREANSEKFAAAEIAEFRKTGDRGLGVYTTLRRDADPGVKAGALFRLARLQLASVDTAGAMRTYRELAGLTGIAISGMPADLFARRQICRLLEQAGDKVSLEREADSLRTDLQAGRWTLDRGGWEVSAEEVARWTGRQLETSAQQRALTEALDWLWQHVYRVDRRGGSTLAENAGRRMFRHDDVSVLLQWRIEGTELTALLIPPSEMTHWAQDAMPKEFASFDSLVLTDEEGAIILGAKAATGSRLVARPAIETGLPWNIALKPPSTPVSVPELETRRRLLTAGLGALVILLAGGGYLSWRIVQRELAVARLQTEFVAAVSHEFRTPLTSMQHVTELLEEDDELPPARRKPLVTALGRSTVRLRGLVESLLDFARMEDGRKPYDLQPLDPSALVRRVVAEFEGHSPEKPALTLDLPELDAVRCRADASALGHALWNLLDNAVKYSLPPHPVNVSVRRQGGDVAIAVADRGFGIPAGECRSVFRKFVRGGDTMRRGIKGTGLGLAIVSHIVAAHHGRIELDSEEGRGSTFTIVLPGA